MDLITKNILKKTGAKVEKELGEVLGFRRFNDGGVECEIGAFLYALTIMLKPARVLETGTHMGIASSYIGLGLKHNRRGTLETIEFDEQFLGEAKRMWMALKIKRYIQLHHMKFEDFKMESEGGLYDLVLLDTEPNLRFDEFKRVFPFVRKRGLIVIHDLHPHMSHGVKSDDHPEMKNWPFGDFREKMGRYIKEDLIQVHSFSTPRGLFVAQKVNKEDPLYRYKKGEI